MAPARDDTRPGGTPGRPAVSAPPPTADPGPAAGLPVAELAARMLAVLESVEASLQRIERHLANGAVAAPAVVSPTAPEPLAAALLEGAGDDGGDPFLASMRRLVADWTEDEDEDGA